MCLQIRRQILGGCWANKLFQDASDTSVPLEPWWNMCSEFSFAVRIYCRNLVTSMASILPTVWGLSVAILCNWASAVEQCGTERGQLSTNERYLCCVVVSALASMSRSSGFQFPPRGGIATFSQSSKLGRWFKTNSMQSRGLWMSVTNSLILDAPRLSFNTNFDWTPV